MSAEEVRERVRQAKKPGRKIKVWEEPNLDSFRRTTVLAFDQSLKSTGWVLFDFTSKGASIAARGTLVNPLEDKGHVGSIRRAKWLRNRFSTEFGIHDAPMAGIWAPVIVAEATPVMGYRLESSLLAAYVLFDVYGEQLSFINRQSAVVALLPFDRRSEKKHTQLLVDRFVADDQPGRWNEHQRDAFMLGLKAIMRKDVDQ